MLIYNYLFSLPNLLTFTRISVIPVLVCVFYLPFTWAHSAAAILFIVASLTDWLDGFLARSLSQSTKLGAFLDPVADKLMVCVVLVVVAAEPYYQVIHLSSSRLVIPALFITIPAAIIVSREIIVSALREWMAELGKRASVKVSKWGKVKTTVQMLALTILLYCNQNSNPLLILTGYILLYLAVILTISSMLLYLQAAWLELHSRAC